MTMRRMLFTAEKGEIVLKQKAAARVIENDDRRWQQLTIQVLNCSGGHLEATIGEVRAFIRFTMDRINRAL